MLATFDDAWAIAEGVEGWLTVDQARELFDAARRVPIGCAIVEIGSHRGKSTVLLAAGARSGVMVTAVDPFDDPRWGGGPESLEIFEANLARAGVTDRVQLVRGLSADAAAAWTGPDVGLAWIDGAHDEASVLADIDGWNEHLVDGGELLIHDAFSAVGTTRAVLRRLLWTQRFRYVGCERTLLVFTKQARSPREAALDAARLSRRLPFFARMLAIKLARKRNLAGLERRLMRRPNEPLI